MNIERVNVEVTHLKNLRGSGDKDIPKIRNNLSHDYFNCLNQKCSIISSS